MSEAAVSVLLSPLSLYSWLTSMLLRLVLSVPVLVLTSLYHSLLLLLAWPWCVASISTALLLTCFHMALYLLHMALVVGTMAVLILTRQKTGGESTTSERTLCLQKKLTMYCTQTRFRMFGGRIVQQGWILFCVSLWRKVHLCLSVFFLSFNKHTSASLFLKHIRLNWHVVCRR